MRLPWPPLLPGALLAATATTVLGITARFYMPGALNRALTDPAHASRGLARALLTHSATTLRAAGASELTLVVTDGNPAARLYTHLGFAPAD